MTFQALGLCTAVTNMMTSVREWSPLPPPYSEIVFRSDFVEKSGAKRKNYLMLHTCQVLSLL